MTYKADKKNKGISTLYMPTLESFMSKKTYENNNPVRAIHENRIITINLKSLCESASDFIWNGKHVEFLNEAGKIVGTMEAVQVHRRLRNLGIGGKINESKKLIKESTDDGPGFSITGEYEGTPQVIEGQVLSDCLMSCAKIAISASDFVNKVVYGITDQTGLDAMSKEDIATLKTWYDNYKNGKVSDTGRVNESTTTYPDIAPADSWDGCLYKLPFTASNIPELIELAKNDDTLMSFLRTELTGTDSVQLDNGKQFVGSDVMDHIPREPRKSIAMPEGKIPAETIKKINAEVEQIQNDAVKNAGGDWVLTQEDDFSDMVLSTVLQKYGFTLDDYYAELPDDMPESKMNEEDGVASVDFIITGHRDGKPKVFSDKELFHLLRANADVSDSPEDFIEKVTYGVTEDGTISDEDKEHLKQWYGKWKSVNESADDETFYVTLETRPKGSEDSVTGIMKVSQENGGWVATIAKGDKKLFAGAEGKYSGALHPDDVAEMMAIEYDGASVSHDISPEDLNETYGGMDTPEKKELLNQMRKILGDSNIEYSAVKAWRGLNDKDKWDKIQNLIKKYDALDESKVDESISITWPYCSTDADVKTAKSTFESIITKNPGIKHEFIGEDTLGGVTVTYNITGKPEDIYESMIALCGPDYLTKEDFNTLYNTTI